MKEIIDKNTSVVWEQTNTRAGDIQFSRANTKFLNEMGWSAQININNGLKQCFGETNEQ